MRHPAATGGIAPAAHSEKAVQGVYGYFGDSEKGVQGLHDHFGDSEKGVQGLHGRFTHCERAVQVLHGRFTHCERAVQVLHGHFTHFAGATQVLHTHFTHTAMACPKGGNRMFTGSLSGDHSGQASNSSLTVRPSVGWTIVEAISASGSRTKRLRCISGWGRVSRGVWRQVSA